MKTRDMLPGRRDLILQASALAAAAVASPLAAQQAVTRILSPYAAGGGADLIARLVRADDKLRFFATSGQGNITHFYGLMLAGAIKVPLQDVPFQSGASAMLGVMSGQVPGGISSVGTSFVQAHNDKRIRILAVMSAARSPFLPDVPTMTEAGIPEIASNDWVGLFAPAETPAAVSEPIAATLGQVTRQASYREGLQKLMMAPMVANPAECAALLRRDYATRGPIVRASGVKEG